MKKNKFIKRSVALACAFTALATTTACGGGKKEDGDHLLEVFLWEAGYGSEWCFKMADEFKTLDWVKEKYPNLEIKIEANSDNHKAEVLFDAGEAGGNTVDLFFVAGCDEYTGGSYTGKVHVEDLTEVVYNQTVPGESIKVKDKMYASMLKAIQHYGKGQDSNQEVPFKSYIFPWVGGMDGLIYNADHLETLGVEVPLTTRQLIDTCELAKNSKILQYNSTSDAKGGYAIMTDGGGNYWDDIYDVWWGQYEGIKGYTDFFNGFDGEGISYNVHRQKGKLYSLKVLEELCKWDNGYVYQNHSALDYMAAQTRFYSGDGVFYANGDYLADEMKEVVADLKEFEGVEYNIRLMKAPIVSEIIELTPSIDSDEMLRAVIKAIDAGYVTQNDAKAASFYANPETLGISAKEAAKCADIEEEDYAKILDARSIQSATGSHNPGCVPVYAKGKEIAFDFLKFMATDKAQAIYAKYTSGSNLPFYYDMKVKNPEIYAEIPQLEKDRADIASNGIYDLQFLSSPSRFPLVKWGGMAAVKSTGAYSLINYFMSKGVSASAQQLWEDDIKYYETEFANCMSQAGLG